jgi:putative transposase
MEGCFGLLKKEPVHDEGYATRGEARANIFEYIEVSYDRVRRHPSPVYKSPVESKRAR